MAILWLPGTSRKLSTKNNAFNHLTTEMYPIYVKKFCFQPTDGKICLITQTNNLALSRETIAVCSNKQTNKQTKKKGTVR
jgi:hypothetical protein